uniref:Uncharacterized protein n=2 Tax=Oryza nivara TaxID=4536 RepID=A0A0E0IJT1_ORYNI
MGCLLRPRDFQVSDVHAKARPICNSPPPTPSSPLVDAPPPPLNHRSHRADEMAVAPGPGWAPPPRRFPAAAALPSGSDPLPSRSPAKQLRVDYYEASTHKSLLQIAASFRKTATFSSRMQMYSAVCRSSTSTLSSWASGSMITFWIFCIAFYAWSYQLQKGNEGETWIGSRDKTCESFKRCWRRTWACTEAQPAETGDRRKCLHISSSTKRSWITGKMHIHVERAASTN